MTKEKQLARFQDGVQDFIQCISSMNEQAFLEKFNGWTPRDVVAHLIGWNRYFIQGSQQIKKGELPFYDLDPGENYSKVNADLIAQYPSVKRQELLDELTESAREVKMFLSSLDDSDWNHDYGVRHNSKPVTIRNTLEEVIEDHVHHRIQIDSWIKRKNGSA